MNSLEILRNKRKGFAGDGDELPAETCERIYKAAFDRVCDMVGHVDHAPALCPEPAQWDFSEVFWARHDDMILSVDTEWLSDHPNIDKFKALVAEWEEFCRQELRAIYNQISGAKPSNVV